MAMPDVGQPRITSGSMPVQAWISPNSRGVYAMTSGSSSYLAAVIQYPPGWTQEQIDADIHQRNEMFLREKERARLAEVERQRAETRANALLMEYLTGSQLEEFQRMDSFTVRAQSGVRYRIRRMQQVEVLDWRSKPAGYYCIIPTRHVPSGDLMLAQKLLLETNERQFLKTANWFGRR